MAEGTGSSPGRRAVTPERRATMRDVARMSSVSVMTVSRVVNNSPNVDPTTRERVLEAIEALGFQPNEAASSLRRNGMQTSTVGLVVDDITNPFCAAVQRGVERVCRRRDHLLVSGSSEGDPAGERALLKAFLRRRVDGLIVMGIDPDEGYLAGEMRRGIPSVFVDRKPHGLEADLVGTDNVAAARIAVDHLLHRGHRRVALLTPSALISTSADRLEGYLGAHAAAGLTADPELIASDLNDAADTDAAVRRLIALPQPPTAVFAAQNLVAIQALRTLHALGVADTVALVAFDDFELADLVRPGVTVIAQSPELMGETAAELVFSRRESNPGPARTVIIPARLVTRGSGEIPPPR